MAAKLCIAVALAAACASAPLPAASDTRGWQADLAALASNVTRFHVNPFHSISKQAFDARVAALAAAIPAMSDDAIVVGLKKLVATIGDAHTGFGFSSAPPMNFLVFPIKVYRYPDGVYVQAAAPEYSDIVGARILSIGGVPMERAEAQLDELADASNVWTKRWWLPFTFRGKIFHVLGLSDRDDRATFVVARAGEAPKTVTLPVVDHPFGFGYNLGAPPKSGWIDRRGSASPAYLQHAERALWFTPLPGGTLYVRCNIVGDDENTTFRAFFNSVFAYADRHAIQKLVLDLRMNGGGNNELTPIVTSAIVRRPALDRRGHLFVIVGRTTQSAAENLVDRLERDTHAIFVGEPTGERPNMYGDPQTFTLPNSAIKVNISSLYWQDMGPRDDRDTTGPEIAAELTEADFERGVDPAMDAIASANTTSFEETLVEAAAKGTTALDEAYKAYLGAPVHRFFQPELGTEDLIFEFVLEKKIDSAAALAALNVERFPTANAYDSLGQVGEARGDANAAKAAYTKALEIDPRDAVAASWLSSHGGF